MTAITIINIATGVAVVATVTALIATIVHIWKRYCISVREAKLPHAGSYKAGLDPDRLQVFPEENPEEADADSLSPGLDPDRPPPPTEEEADEPDVAEEAIHHG